MHQMWRATLGIRFFTPEMAQDGVLMNDLRWRQGMALEEFTKAAPREVALPAALYLGIHIVEDESLSLGSWRAASH